MGGKFRVVAKLGQGGMGTVYEAEHLELKQRVALKVILASERSPEISKRFQREAIVLGQLESDHVVRVLDFGALADETPYLVMEFLKGMDFEEYVRHNGPLSVAEAAEVGIAVCDALIDAHGKGIVHRDIKPSNIFLVDRPGRRMVKVLDFGISLLRRPGDESITHTHAVLGTPHYTAPEQLTASKKADSRADVWSLGASLFQLVTSDVPFPAATLAELAILLQKPPRLASSLNANVSEAFAKVIDGCLQRKLQDRCPSARDLRRQLKAFRVFGRTTSVFGESLSEADREALLRAEEHFLPSAAPEDSVPAEVTDVSGAPAFAEPEQKQITPKVALVAPRTQPNLAPTKRVAWLVGGLFGMLVIVAGVVFAAQKVRESKPDPWKALATAPPIVAPSALTLPTVPDGLTNVPVPTGSAPSLPVASTSQASGATRPIASPPSLPPAKVLKAKPSSGSPPHSPRGTLLAPGER